MGGSLALSFGTDPAAKAVPVRPDSRAVDPSSALSGRPRATDRGRLCLRVLIHRGPPVRWEWSRGQAGGGRGQTVGVGTEIRVDPGELGIPPARPLYNTFTERNVHFSEGQRTYSRR